MRARLGRSESIIARGCLLSALLREVHRGKSKKTGAMFALKKIIMHNEKDGVSTV